MNAPRIISIVVGKECQGQQRTQHRSHRSLRFPFRQGHPVEFAQTDKRKKHDETGENEEGSLNNQQDEERQRDCRRKYSSNGQLLSDG